MLRYQLINLNEAPVGVILISHIPLPYSAIASDAESSTGEEVEKHSSGLHDHNQRVISRPITLSQAARPSSEAKPRL